MRKAADTPLQELLPATIRVIDRLLADRPSDTSSNSDDITGYKGVRVIFYPNPVQSLQVTGPEPLLDAVIKPCADRGLKPWPEGRKSQLILFIVP